MPASKAIQGVINRQKPADGPVRIMVKMSMKFTRGPVTTVGAKSLDGQVKPAAKPAYGSMSGKTYA